MASANPLLGDRDSFSTSTDSDNMGSCLSTEGEATVPVYSTSSKDEVCVYVHGLTHPETFCTDDLKLSLQEICVKVLKKHFPTCGPAVLPLFGFAVINLKAECKMLWKNIRLTLKDMVPILKNSDNRLYLRVRFIPTQEYIGKLFELGKDLVKYLCFQCIEDFQSSRLKTIFESKYSQPKARGLAVLAYLIMSKIEDKKVESSKLSHDHYLPKEETPKTWNLKKWRLKNNMKDSLNKYDQEHPYTNIEQLMLAFIKDMLNNSMSYKIEKYTAKLTGSAGHDNDVTVYVDIYNELSGLFINEVIINGEFYI